MNARQRRPGQSSGDYSATVRREAPPTPKSAIPLAIAAVRKKRGYELAPGYDPTDAEFDFVDAVYKAEVQSRIPQEIADQVQMLQFRKVRGAKLYAPSEAVSFLKELAKKHGVEPQF